MIIFRPFHSPGDRGWLYWLLLDLDWKSLRFTRLGRSTACRLVSPREPLGLVRSGLHGDSRSRSQTVLEIELNSSLYVSQIIYDGH